VAALDAAVLPAIALATFAATKAAFSLFIMGRIAVDYVAASEAA
jgi:hypothetical protein